MKYVLFAFLIVAASIARADDAYLKLIMEVTRNFEGSTNDKKVAAAAKKVCAGFETYAKSEKNKVQALIKWDAENCLKVAGEPCDKPKDKAVGALLRSAVSKECKIN